MLWELSVTEQRYRAVLEVLAGVPVTEVADRYGVSRQSVHTWLRRYREEGRRAWRTAVTRFLTITAPRTTSRDIRRHKASSYSRDS